MSKPGIVVLMLAVLVAAPVLGADKSSELARPKDFSRDSQVAAPPATPNAVILSEGFGSGIPGTWQVIDNAGEGPIWTNLAGCGESGNYTNGTGDVACVSSDLFGAAEFDTELRTPAFDLSGYTAPASLAFTVNYQNFAASDFFQVDVSTDGGGSWTNLLSWNEDHGSFRATPGEDVNLDIGSYAGQPSVMFRFHYFDPNEEDWDWYVQVDDVVVNATAPVLQPADVFGTKTVAGSFVPGGTITYTIVLSNTGAGAQGDNAGDEFSDTLPTSLTATGATASSGTVARVGNLVTWNGSIPAGGSVTITITATVNAVAFGTTISNQGTIYYDAAGGGTNGATRLTDDPAVAGAANPTAFLVADPTAVPGLQPVGLAALALLTALAAAFALRRIA